jgi:hypothetical protein
VSSASRLTVLGAAAVVAAGVLIPTAAFATTDPVAGDTCTAGAEALVSGSDVLTCTGVVGDDDETTYSWAATGKAVTVPTTTTIDQPVKVQLAAGQGPADITLATTAMVKPAGVTVAVTRATTGSCTAKLTATYAGTKFASVANSSDWSRYGASSATPVDVTFVGGKCTPRTRGTGNQTNVWVQQLVTASPAVASSPVKSGSVGFTG